MVHFLKYARGSAKLIAHDPLAGVKFVKPKKSSGHLPWESDECDWFDEHHALGTKARLAYELLLQLGDAKCDIIRIGPQYVKNGELSFHRKKTKVEFHVFATPESRHRLQC